MRPARTYPLAVPALDDLAQAVSTLDDISTDPDHKALVERCHDHLVQALGRDACLVYGPEEKAA